uniref:OSIGBa0103I21.7 protein n=1 Tax=Oryza sativa TaxID=4530 RepID=Q01MZ1_ORYSA|nr:OSIGBa0103I21.7 [Oryza sativa]
MEAEVASALVGTCMPCNQFVLSYEIIDSMIWLGI